MSRKFNKEFKKYVDEKRAKGMSDKQILKELKMLLIEEDIKDDIVDASVKYMKFRLDAYNEVINRYPCTLGN